MKILEVGCGMGYLTYALYKEGYNAIGLDISQNAIDEAIRDFGQHYICDDVFEYSGKHKEEYDRVILTQVIEHIEDPVKWLTAIAIMLKKGGKIILSTENKTIYPSHAIWQTDLPPVHLWWFSEQSMKFIADKLTIKISFTDFSNYNQGEQGFFIYPVPYDKHCFDENGECIKTKLLPRNRFLCMLTKKYSLAYNIFLKLHHLYYFNRRRRYDILYTKNRGIMGCIFTK